MEIKRYFSLQAAEAIKMEIDPTGAALDKAISERGAVYAFWRNRYSAARNQLAEANYQLKLVKSRLSLKIRGIALLVDSDECDVDDRHSRKLAQGVIDDLVETHPEYLKALEDVIAAQAIEDIGRGILEALRERNEAITNTIYNQQHERKLSASVSVKSD